MLSQPATEPPRRASEGSPPPFARDDHPVEDHYVHLRGATWEDYERLLALRGESAVPRLSFLEGLLEIMSPTRNHDYIKSIIGRLVEAFCLDRGIEFSTYGSWTIKERKDERGAEPDECWIFGPNPLEVPRPHVAVEVVWTSGGISKLEIYRKLGVAEVWIWRKGEIQVHALRGERYEPIARSEFLPDLDLGLVARCVAIPTTSQAIRAFRAGAAPGPEPDDARPELDERDERDDPDTGADA